MNARAKLLECRKERAREFAVKLAKEYRVPVECILDGGVRDQAVVRIRHMLFRLLFETGMSKTAVAMACGVNHATVFSALAEKRSA